MSSRFNTLASAICERSPHLIAAEIARDKLGIDTVRATMPRAEAVLFMHAVTGLLDIDEILDTHNRPIGVRARSRGPYKHVFVELLAGGDPG